MAKATVKEGNPFAKVGGNMPAKNGNKSGKGRGNNPPKAETNTKGKK